MVELNKNTMLEALQMLGERLRLKQSTPVQLVVCGGSALLALNLVTRTTTDIDIVALVDVDDRLISAIPLPVFLKEAIREVALLRGLSEDWLNNGPDFGTGGSLNGDLPEGLLGRAHRIDFGTHLTVYFIDRIDQIYFKVYAAVDSDRQSVHVSDLISLQPNPEEMRGAADWCIVQDPSESFRKLLRDMYEQLGFGDVAEGL